MTSALNPGACEILRCVAISPFYLCHGACGSGLQHCWGGGLGVLTCPGMPQGCGVALVWAHCQEKHKALTSHHSLWKRWLQVLVLWKCLFCYNGTIKSWGSWPRFGSREVRDEALNSAFYTITSESSEGLNPLVFAACMVLLVMKVRVAVWKPKVFSDHISGFGWHLARKLGFSLFSPIPHEQRGHRFDWKELISFLDTYLFWCITQILFHLSYA